jgi:cobalt-precorrin-5B (C1)-methyltransferase
VAEVELAKAPGVAIRGGAGVATVTKPGLGLDVGSPAVNPIPRRNITEMVEEEIRGSAWKGAVVTVSVPGGEEMAKETTNARLGLLGGISILGTTGIVKPYSTAAYKASVVQAIDVAAARAHQELVFTTGGKSEAYAMALLPHLKSEEAFIQVGDFIGVGVKHAARRKIRRVHIVGMMGKLSKMADGKMMTHAAGSEVNMTLLADLATELGAPSELREQILAANTARHVLELCAAAGLTGITSLVCVAERRRGTRRGSRYPRQAGGLNGALLGTPAKRGRRREQEGAPTDERHAADDEPRARHRRQELRHHRR